jgi:ribonuclease HII
MKYKYIIGVDEVGRGPLAGPVAVCAFKIPAGILPRQIEFLFDWGGFMSTKKSGRIKDSKKLTSDKREEIFARLKILKKEKTVDYFVSYESAKRIDKLGISKAIKNCLEKSLAKLKVKPEQCLILLDGGLHAPEKYKNQKTIIKGDEKERAIAFASIVAKVSRDTLMCKLSKKYPKYCFEIHKGYGTKKHCEAIKKNGLSKEHRRCFCKNFI